MRWLISTNSIHHKKPANGRSSSVSVGIRLFPCPILCGLGAQIPLMAGTEEHSMRVLWRGIAMNPPSCAENQTGDTGLCTCPDVVHSKYFSVSFFKGLIKDTHSSPVSLSWILWPSISMTGHEPYSASNHQQLICLTDNSLKKQR